MMKLQNWVAGIALSVCATTAMSAPADVVYDFTTDAYSPSPMLGFELNGPTTGKMVTKYSEQINGYIPDTLTFQVGNQPPIVARNFVANNMGMTGANSYSAHVANAWIYRSIKVNVDAPNGFTNPNMVAVYVTLDYMDTFVNQPSQPANEGPVLVDFGFEPVARYKFSTIDVYRTTFDNKTVALRLNKYLSNKPSPMAPTPEPGIEIKATWYGHGEGSFILPMPTGMNIAPYAIISDKDINSGSQEEMLTVKYKENGMDQEVMVPLSIVLQEAIQ